MAALDVSESGAANGDLGATPEGKEQVFWTQVRGRAPHARCYVCDATGDDIVAVCHECGRAMCAAHRTGPSEPVALFIAPEYDDLNLSRAPTGDRGEHCTYHHHDALRVEVVFYIGLIISLVSVFAIVWTWLQTGPLPRFWFWALTFGIILLMVGFFLYYVVDRQRTLRQRPPLPVLGRLPRLTVSELVRGRIRLDGYGSYHVRATGYQGQVDYELQLAPADLQRLRLFERRYGRTEGIPYNAGFAVLHGPARLQLREPSRAPRTHTLEFDGEVADIPFFGGSMEARNARYHEHVPYTFTPAANIFPVQIVPALVADGNRRAVALTVQLPPALKVPAARALVRNLTLCAPHQLGAPEVWRPAASINPDDARREHPGCQLVVWENVPFSDEGFPDPTGGIRDESAEAFRELEREEWEGARAQRADRPLQSPGATFYVRYARDLGRETVLHGRLQLRLPGRLLSGLSGATYFYALGGAAHNASIRTYTDVDVDFTLDLAQLPYYETAAADTALRLRDVVADAALLGALVSRLAAAGYYVKRVVETPAQDDEGQGVRSRGWEIVGRTYDGLFPVDFTIVASGREPLGQAAPPTTTFTIGVRARVSNRVQRTQVDGLPSVLRDVVELAATQGPAPPPGKVPGWEQRTPPPIVHPRQHDPIVAPTPLPLDPEDDDEA